MSDDIQRATTAADAAVQRAKVYGFLGQAFLYPADNWLDDLPLLAEVLRDLPGMETCDPPDGTLDLPGLQAEHRRTFGLTGSLCYETECGLPHEFRQSQELADIAGFYRAFGFAMGGAVRERPDHLAAELEFMHVLALKEAYAMAQGLTELVEICADAQRKFLKEHLGGWIGLFAQALAQTSAGGPYLALGRFAAAFVRADADRLGLRLEPPGLATVRPTPLGPELSCEGCPMME